MKRFFENPPAITWMTWICRKLLHHPLEPRILTTVPAITKSPTGVKPTQALPQHAEEYSTFLANHYTTTAQLKIHPHLFEKYLGNALIGAEIRDVDKKLVGIVFSWYAGLFEKTPMGLITWLCVIPSWRKKGITDCLLYAVEVFAKRPIHWFRNDGWMKSPLPPVWTEAKMVRRRNTNRPSIVLHQISLASCIDRLRSSWNTQQNGIMLYDPTSASTSLLEIWEYKKTLLLVQPTFEVERGTKKRWCEVIYWVGHSAYETSMELEVMIDNLSYDWIEAPTTMPHMDAMWKVGGHSTWSVYGLDPGNPVMRPILPLLVA